MATAGANIIRIVAVLAVPWGLGPRAAAQEECRACHPREAAAHSQSHHARAIRPIVDTEFFRNLPGVPIGEARGGFLFSYSRQGQALQVTAQRGNERATSMIEWAFGAGDQGVTPLARKGEQWIEHRISYYTRSGRFDLTLGHQPGASASAEAALGQPQEPAVAKMCFDCHGGQAAKGVACGSCHAGAQAHARGSGKATHPGKLSRAAQVELCATCHRLTPPNGNWNDPLNIRFQPLRMSQSACYRKGEITCGTCHAPHESARRADAAFYRDRCLSCHASQKAKGDCLSCHMPKSSPAPHLSFTDHWIRRAPAR